MFFLLALWAATFWIGRYYAVGLAQYCRLNNKTGVEDCWASVTTELAELKSASGLANILWELCDVFHATLKYLTVGYLPTWMWTSPLFWASVFILCPFLLPCTIKLGLRFRKHGCIRNHRNPQNRGHSCYYRQPRLKIYYGASVSGTFNSVRVREEIAFLKNFGIVLTEHMAAQNIDENKTQEQIYQQDEMLLKQADLFIANITNPSTGTGFMTAKAINLGIPVLCLYDQTAQTKTSAMIQGCKQITTKGYTDLAGFKRQVKTFIARKTLTQSPICILLSGPPGSGKSTVGRRLADKFGLEFVSTGDLLRQLPDDSATSAMVRPYMEAGATIPSHIMAEILKERLDAPDCQAFGFVLDGYPPTMKDLDEFRKLSYEPLLIFCFECSDTTAIQRQCNRGERSTDTAALAKVRLETFNANPNFVKYGHAWFPRTPVVKIDAERHKDDVWETVNSTVSIWIDHARGNKTKNSSSFFPIEGTAQSTRFHFHVDAESTHDLMEVCGGVYAQHQSAQGQIKIYPIVALSLGVQTKQLDIYKKMMNFHTIENSESEAFVTGRLGSFAEDAKQLFNCTLAAAQVVGKPIMVELEEYIGEWTYTCSTGFEVQSLYDISDLNIDFDLDVEKYKHARLKHMPLELHLGFDLPKQDNNPPISVDWLNSECANRGMANGGWFIFGNESKWCYRSNEFSDGTEGPGAAFSIEHTQQKLFDQAASLSELVEVPIMLSLEIVHGIWQF